MRNVAQCVAVAPAALSPLQPNGKAKQLNSKLDVVWYLRQRASVGNPVKP